MTSDFPSLTINRALQLSDLATILPVKPTSPATPGGQIPIYNRNTAVFAYDPNFKSPYTQNMTFSLTRTVSRDLVVDLRYEGALGRRRADGNGLNVNLANVYHNKELFDALEIQREREAWLQENKEAMNAKIERGLAQLDRGEGIRGDELRTSLAADKAAWIKDRSDS